MKKIIIFVLLTMVVLTGCGKKEQAKNSDNQKIGYYTVAEANEIVEEYMNKKNIEGTYEVHDSEEGNVSFYVYDSNGEQVRNISIFEGINY